jgi:ABC-2 type transport system ATP-binding protein
MSAVIITDLVKTYKNGHQALKKVSLNIEQGDFFALLGPNGAGKTTLIGILTGLVNKTAGKVSVFGFDLDTQLDQVKECIGVVPQEFNFNIFEKVFDIVVAQAGYYGIPRKVAEERTTEVLKALELWDKKDVPSRALSGGMKRRLMIARALIHRPRLLILDEPTAGVDVELRRGMWEYLQNLNVQGTTILLTTHYLEEVEQLCRNVAVIKQGELVKVDSVKKVLSSFEKQTFQLTVQAATPKPQLAHYLINVIDETTWEVDLTMSQSITSLIRELDQAGVEIKDIRAKGNRLENFFLDLVKK